MMFKKSTVVTIIALLFILGCKDKVQKKTSEEPIAEIQDSIKTVAEIPEEEKTPTEEEEFKLNEENSIAFFFDYQKDLKEDKVKLTTSMGSFTVQLYDNVPYHKANFIYLTRQGYFDGTQFHRVVENFIIQGGNADDEETAKKRGKIGRYLLPPDTRKGYKHHRGTLSMPSSEINNPHKLASPYEFFIVVTNPGSYHLDGEFTPFGKVIQGMNVVDKINKVRVSKGDWPAKNVYIEKAEIVN